MLALVSGGATIDQPRDNGCIPLKDGGSEVRQRGEAVAAVMLAAGAEINKAMDVGLNSLYFASYLDQVAMVVMLVRAGAEIDKAGDSGATPFFVATLMGYEAVAAALIEAGAE